MVPLTRVRAALVARNLGFSRVGVGGGGLGPAVWGACGSGSFRSTIEGLTVGGELANGCSGPKIECCSRRAWKTGVGTRRRSDVRANRRAMSSSSTGCRLV